MFNKENIDTIKCALFNLAVNDDNIEQLTTIYDVLYGASIDIDKENKVIEHEDIPTKHIKDCVTYALKQHKIIKGNLTNNTRHVLYYHGYKALNNPKHNLYPNNCNDKELEHALFKIFKELGFKQALFNVIEYETIIERQ